MSKRRNYTASFKRKVALEALRAALTLPQIADKYAVAVSMVGKWKKAAIDGLPSSLQGMIPLLAISTRSEHCILKSGNWLLKRRCGNEFKKAFRSRAMIATLEAMKDYASSQGFKQYPAPCLCY